MNINELDSYNLGDAVKFHRRLNPRIWGRDEHLLPEVREKLLTIAADFQEFLGVEDLNVKDITVSGSNAAYSYTKNSDIDLHLVVDMPADPVYQELFTAKKYQWNDEHNIRIGGAEVELYVQPTDQAHHSQGIYSIKNSDWVSVPQRKRAQVDDACVRDKVASLDARIHSAVKSKNPEAIGALWDKIKNMRKVGLEQHGEFGCENIAFKILRNNGCIKLLKDTKTAIQDQQLSLREEPAKPVRYGFRTMESKEDSDSDEQIVNQFIQHTAKQLGIDPLPKIVLHSDPAWSENNHSFGRYDHDTHTLNVSMPNRHIMDVLRTTAHELVHCEQHQRQGHMPADAGETGSPYENDANARAGIIMRDWAKAHPDYFEMPALEEGASGYIPKNKREARMPQYAMALSVDIHPGQTGKEANKLGLKTGRNGEPGLLSPSAQNLLREFSEFSEEQENLFEISMSPTSLKKLSAQTGALAGMEFEMCVPNTEGDDNNGDQEPDYEYDERCRSIEDAVQFFHDGDWNGRRDVERLRDRMQNDYQEWLSDKLYQDWERSGEEYLEEWVPNNVDESEWNPDGLEGEARQEALEEFIAAMHADPGSSDAFDEYREENQDSYDESDWLDAEDLDLMSYVENAYDVTWPHWSSVGSGETSIEDVADSFSNAVGRPVQASGSYHSGRVERPSTKNPHYLVEPDSSIDVDDRDDRGLEFVSPPLPIEELLSDLNKVKAWADKTGCYTNDSTGLHINVSVPGWTAGSNQLDYVKLAVLLGDEHVLESFGRAGNTYCKSAMGKIQSIIRQNPAKAEEMLERMRQGMDQLASKAIHSGTTDKYTSINNKNGYIEFRSPGGDWLNDNFAEIDNTLRRFTVAMSAAVDPEAYRKEYLKKLYKLLDVGSEKDPLSYFAKYAAGELPKAALKSFVRQAQLERKVKKISTSDAKLPWRLYDVTVNEWATDSKGQGVYFDGTRDEALRQVKDYIQNQRNSGDTHNYDLLRNNTQPAQNTGALAQSQRQYYNVSWAEEEDNGTTTSTTIVQATSADAAVAEMRDRLHRRGIEFDNVRATLASQPPQDNLRPYELYSRTLGAVFDTFMARNDDEAMIRLNDYREHGAGQSNPDDFGVRRADSGAAGASTTDSHPEGRGRPHDPTGQYAIVARSDQAVYGRTGGPAPVYQFRFNMANLEDQGHGRYVLQAWAARNGVNPADYMIVDTTQYAGPAAQQQDDVTPFEIYNRDTGDVVSTVMARNAQEALAELDQFRAEQVRAQGITIPRANALYGVRHAPIPGSTMDLQRQRAAAAQDQQQGGTIDVATDQPAPRPTGEFTGQWKVLVNGNEVWRFRGVGNRQADANRVASDWLDNNGYSTIGNQIEVYPVMSESLTESNRLTLRDFVVNISPHALSQAHNKGVDVHMVDDILRNIGKVKDNIMSLEPGRALILHNGHGTGLGVRRGQGNNLTLATVFPTSTGFRKGKHPTFRVETDTKNIDEAASDYEIHSEKKLDSVLARCCDMITQGQSQDSKRYGRVAACVIDPDNRHVYGINLPGTDGTRRHAERVAIDKYRSKHGDIPAGSIVVTTLSPCNAPMDERAGESCKDLLNSVGIHKVYCGYIDPTQHDDKDADFVTGVTQNDDIWETCKAFADTFLHENFADGKNPGRKGLAKRMGVNTKASVSSLRNTAKHSSGEKQRMAHWLANMKSGRAKNK